MVKILAISWLLHCLLQVSTAYGWNLARATYYGAPDYFSQAFDPTRGQGSFGILAYGACGYTNSDGSIPFPSDEVAASADKNPDYAGSCGRCYLVKCHGGEVQDNNGNPIGVKDGAYSNGQIYLPYYDKNIKDTSGRSFPGNSAEGYGQEKVQCWNNGTERFIRIIDSCPCTQVLPSGAPGVKEGGETRKQPWCCGGIPHFDISFHAFESLAHPLYGVMMLDYKPVDCETRQELPLVPGHISEQIYSNGAKPGWSWVPLFASGFQFATDKAPDGTSATCVSGAEKNRGGLSFRCRDCYKAGYQPFTRGESVTFWIKGWITSLKVFMKNEEFESYCKQEVYLRSYKSYAEEGQWSKYTIPLSAFDCSYPSLANITNISFQNVSPNDIEFCVASLTIDSKSEVKAAG